MTTDSNSQARMLRFATFEADLNAKELRKGGVKIKVHGQPFEVLAMLLEQPGEIVPREELKQKLWPTDTFVDFDHGVNTAIKRLREALGDSAENPRFVETIPRRGYRFIAPVEPPATAPEAKHASKRQKRIVAFAMALGIGVAALIVASQRQRLFARRSGPPIQSIAVLPLTNLSSDADQDYFADGMTDALITDLGKIGSLRVISRTSVVQYKGTKKSLPEIARELNVDAIIEGTVSRSGNHVRITASLLQASPEKHLWADSYDSEVADALSVQGELAQAVAREIKVTLTPKERNLLATPRPGNPAAYESYWKGEYFLDKLTPESVKKAADYFQDAVAKEPDYVAAYNKLAAANQILGNIGALSKRESRSKAALAINKALALDPLSGPAHAQKGWLALLNDLDFTTAEAEFKRAVELSPNEVQGHQGLADYYAAVGQVDQAVLEMERAREVDPLSFIVNFDVCRILYFARRFDEALAQCKANLNFDPKSPPTLWKMEAIYKAKGMDEEAATVFLQVAEGSGAPPDVIATLKKAQHESGLRGMCKVLVLRPKHGDEWREDLLTWASVYTCAGNKDKALELLKRAVDERSFGIVWLGVDPTYDDLRTDPRFGDLLHRMGLPQ